MAKFVITQPGASKGRKDSSHQFYKVGEVVEFDGLPASLIGKARPVSDEATTKADSSIEVKVVNNSGIDLDISIDGSVVTIAPLDIQHGESSVGEGVSDEEMELVLRYRYQIKFGKNADKRWSMETIEEKLAEEPEEEVE